MAKRSPAINVPRGESDERTIFAGTGTPLTQAQLHRQLDPIVRAWLTSACAWTGDEFGDYRFLIFWTDPAPGVQVYVQFWSEPNMPLLCEVSSGKAHRPSEAWLADRVQSLTALGFAIGGEAQNFQRWFDVFTPEHVAQIAEIVANVFYTAFDYRGGTAIAAKLTHDGRAESRLTFDGFTADEIMEVFAGNGFAVEEALGENDEPVVPAVIRCRKRAIETVVHLYDLFDDASYGRMELTAEFPLSTSAAAAIPRPEEAPPDAVPVAVASSIHTFTGGVTLDWLIERVQEWDEMLAANKRQARRGGKRAPRRPTGPRASETVH